MTGITYTGALKGSDGSVLSIDAATLTPAAVDPTKPAQLQPTQAHIGASTYPIAGTNVARAVDQLVRYTGPATATATNQWGAEATITAAGVVAALSDRQATSSTAGTLIPATGYVLSGHGAARTWLLANAKPGATVVLDTTSTPTPTLPSTPTPPATVPSTAVLFGASGDYVAGGQLEGALASRHVAIAGTWADNSVANHLAQSSIGPGGDYATWDRPIDLAVGGLFRAEGGQSWAQAAAGGLDGQWTACLQQIAHHWAPRPFNLLRIRFCHEFNLADMNQLWSVRAGEEADSITARRRWAALQRQILPGSLIVWPVNDGTSGSLGIDVRSCWPGDDVVDLVGVDTYNAWPWVTTQAQWDSKTNFVDGHGAPVGIEQWRQFAAAHGKPICIPEWSNCGDPASAGGGGESPFYIQAMHDWMTTHAGTGPGQVAYAVLFNQWQQYQLWPTTMQPATGAKYLELF